MSTFKVNLNIDGDSYGLFCDTIEERDILEEIARNMNFELRQQNSMKIQNPDKIRRLMLVSLTMMLDYSKEIDKLGKDNFVLNQINAKLRSSLDIAINEE